MITTDNFAFIHMHKTGGQSIIQIIEQCVPSFRNIGYHYPRYLLPPEYSDLPIVGMVRNPWDWYISWYAYNILRNGESPLFFVLSDAWQADYKNTLRNLINLGSDTARSQHYRDTLIEILPESLDDTNRGSGLTKNCIRNFKDDDCGYYSWLFKRMYGEFNSKTTYIGRFENLSDEFLSIMDQLSVEETQAIREKFNGSVRLNESSHSHYSRYYDDDLRGLIAQKDAFLIDKYGYEFEQSTNSEKVIEFPSVQIYGIQDNFQKLSGKDNNFLLLRSDIDVGPIKKKLAQVPEDAWGQSDREHQFETHQQTKALLLIYDSDFRHYDPTYLDIYSQFEGKLKPLLDIIATTFHHDGFVVRLIFAKLQAHGKIPPHADREYSLLKSHRIHVPIVSNDDVFITVGGEQKVMRPGEMWEINNATLHAVDNQSEEDRIHMIIDWVPNATVRSEDRNPVPEQYAMTNIDLLETGLKCYQLGNLDAAEKHFRQLVSRDSSNIHGLNLLGMVCVNTGRQEEAVQLITRALKINPVDAQAYGNLGLAYQRMGNLVLAERHFRKSVEIDTNKPALWNSLGNVLREMGQASDAIKAYESTLKVDGNYPQCWINLSQALIDIGKFERAFQAVNQALQIDPTLPAAHYQVAEVYSKSSKFDLAIRAYKKSLELDPTLYEAMLGLATVYRESEDSEAALTVLNRLIKLEPGHAKAYTVLGILKEQLGDTAAAADCFKKSIELAPDVIAPHCHLSQIKGRKISEDEILAMERFQTMTGISRRDGAYLHFGLGEAYDQQGQTDKAFKAWLTANQMKAERFPYDPDKRKQLFGLIIEYSQALATRLTETPSQEVRQLVFVIGLPRSGTSLTDQILASHTNVSSLGEVANGDDMAVQVKELTGQPYPHGLSGLTRENVGLLRADFLKKIPLKHSNNQVLIDKSPMNFQHLGLLAEVFPDAKFIHCRRTPMDNCFSIFKLSFADDQDYAHELTALGRHYRLYEGMMDKWKEMYPHRILDVHYEDTVADLKAQCVHLVEFLGLAFEPEMLEYYSSERLVRTPSASQVRQPIYKSSVQAWKKYERHLQPLVSALGAEK